MDKPIITQMFSDIVLVCSLCLEQSRTVHYIVNPEDRIDNIQFLCDSCLQKQSSGRQITSLISKNGRVQFY